jgi:formate hydrogenlyase subunit 3/multisubunit Na+/H+ antiporter MnhD subunit
MIFGLTPVGWALVALLGPALAALIIGVVPPLRKAGKPAAYLAVAAAGLALFGAAALMMRQLGAPAEALVQTTRWLPSGGQTIAEIGVRLDGISVPMLVVVTTVAFCVQVFSLGYMADEPPAAFGRYFAYHSLFIFSMNTLVLAPNVLQLFAGWELVGLTSYLLIGYYWQKPSAARAAVKAFWTTKLADMGFVVGVVLLFVSTGGFGWKAPSDPTLHMWIGFGLFLGVMGKSAQFPLHVWLPDAMEGPTPVSALLHAATMVAAGVYLIVRANPLFQALPVRELMTWLGAFTALFAAVVAVVQTDIKKVLAYSTCSQLGYMVSALGAGSLMGGYFHLTTHAAFKALLFLGAGSVIHVVHSNELADMGYLWPKMKVTALTFIIGALALAVHPRAGAVEREDRHPDRLPERGEVARSRGRGPPRRGDLRRISLTLGARAATLRGCAPPPPSASSPSPSPHSSPPAVRAPPPRRPPRPPSTPRPPPTRSPPTAPRATARAPARRCSRARSPRRRSGTARSTPRRRSWTCRTRSSVSPPTPRRGSSRTSSRCSSPPPPPRPSPSAGARGGGTPSAPPPRGMYCTHASSPRAPGRSSATRATATRSTRSSTRRRASPTRGSAAGASPAATSSCSRILPRGTATTSATAAATRADRARPASRRSAGRSAPARWRAASTTRSRSS